MKHQDLLKEMNDSIGTQNPMVYFQKLTQLLGLLFDRLDQVDTQLQLVKKHAALAIQWDARVAANMLTEEISYLEKNDVDTYQPEIRMLRQAYVENKITQEYTDFCRFWQEVLGYHPFLDYK